MSDQGRDRNNLPVLILGGVLLLVGISAIGGQSGLFMSPALRSLGATVREVRTWFGPALIIVAGILLIVTGGRGGLGVTAPPPGTRLYRSVADKRVSGVLGGLAEYYSIDPSLLRFLFVILALLTDAGAFLIGYIIASFVIPVRPAEEPPPPPATP